MVFRSFAGLLLRPILDYYPLHLIEADIMASGE